MVMQVGINGFGRIGRIVCRTCLQNSDLQLSAINDPAVNVEYICYLIKFDSTHGKLQGDITHTDNEIVVDGHHIKVFHEKLPSSVPWHSAGVQYVVEASGMFTNFDKASGHLESDGVKRVIVTAPSVDIPMIVLGVNDYKLNSANTVISCASSTLYCLAPIIKVLDDSFGITEGFITSIHAMTPSLKPLDGLCLRGKHWRDHRSIHQNIIPATTGACKALGKILPQVKDKLSGLAFRVPIVNVSVLDLTVRLNSNTTLQEIVKSVEKASKTMLKHIIRISSEESVSSDFIGENHSCIFDENTSIQLKPNFFKIICWYENEYSYACRVIDTILISETTKQIDLHVPIKMNDAKQMSLKKPITAQLKNEIPLVFCKAEANSKIISSTSQDTGVRIKSPPHQFLIKKPFSLTSPSQTYKGTKKSELFKIWNDTCERPKIAIQNRCSFFQSCLCDPQPPKKIEYSAQECLENVKKEFSKMVNITENLMKKTLSNQSNVRSSVDKMKGVNDINLIDKEVAVSKGVSVEESGDFQSCVDLSNSSQIQTVCKKDEAESMMSFNKVTSECNSNATEDSKEGLDTAVLEMEANENSANKELLKSKKFQFKSYNEKLGGTKNNFEFKQPLTKTINTLIDGLSQNIAHNDTIKTVTTIIEKEKKANETFVNGNTKFSLTPHEPIVPLEIKTNYASKITEVEDGEGKIANIINKFKTRKKRSNIKLIGKALRKRKIVLVDSLVVPKSDLKLCNEENVNLTSANKTDEINMIRSTKETLDSVKHVPDTILVSEDTSRSPSPVTTISNAYESKQDLYDKLDSASESDSNNSIEMKERKSQVIQITDLTNSLEDLARLDKICRIIEISDELSDKLFSALDDSKGTELCKQKWSFKDFCTRIKLDDFCNKVFGGNV